MADFLLKKIIINGKNIPIPVPLSTVGAALEWVQATLVPEGHVITRISINDTPIADEDLILTEAVRSDTKFELQVDSPTELSMQTLDAMLNLTTAVLAKLKPLAVQCWQARPIDKPSELDPLAEDLDLIVDLIDHVSGLLVELHVEPAAIQGIESLLRKSLVGLGMARSNSDWRAYARQLLNRVEPLLKDLTDETEVLMVRMTHNHTRALTGEAKSF